MINSAEETKLTTLTDMNIREGASKALEIICRGWYEGFQIDGYYENQTFEQFMSKEFDVEDGDYSTLDDDTNLWREVKYEGSTEPYTYEGWSAKVAATHGGEGQGDQFWVVISVSDGQTTRYFRKDGWYASFDGGYLDGDTSEVKPQTRSVVYYE